MLTTEDRLAIHELIALYGHIIDERQFSRTPELFTDGALYDVTDFGKGVVVGPTGVTELWADPSSMHPLAHHATNIVVTESDSGTVEVVSKGIGVRTDGRIGSVTYHDTVVQTAHGWRISHRTARLRDQQRTPPTSEP